MNVYNQFFATELPELPASLNNPSAADQALRMFGIETGDAFIKKTPIEGHHTVQTYKRFLEGMESIIQTSQLPIHLEPFKKASEWANKIENIQSREDLRLVANEMKTAVETLKVGGELWLPIGWGDRDGGGHAMSLCIRRISKSRYEVTTLNTGAGIENHPAILIDGKRKVQTFLTIDGVASNRLCQQEFFETILEMRCAWMWDVQSKYSSAYWYETVLPYLGGHRQKGWDYRKFPALYQLPQRSGTCSMEAIFALLHYQLKEQIPLYKKTKILYRQWALNTSLKDFKNAPNYSIHKLISHVAQQQARSIQKGFEKWGLTESLYKELTADLVTIEIESKKIKQDALQHEKEIHTSPIQVMGSPFRKDVIQANHTDNETNSAAGKKQAPIKTDPPVQYGLSNPCDLWTPDQVLIKETGNHSSLPVKEIQTWINRCLAHDLLPHLHDPFWSKLPEKELTKWIDALVSSQLVKKQGAYFLDTQSSVNYFYVLAIIDQLVRRHPDLKNQLKGYHLFCRSDLVNFAFSKETILFQPSLQKRLLEVLEYYQLDKFDPSSATKEDLDRLDENSAINRKQQRLKVGSSTISKNPSLKFLSQFYDPHSNLTKVEQIVEFLKQPFSNAKTPPAVLQTLFRFIFFNDSPYEFSGKWLYHYTEKKSY